MDNPLDEIERLVFYRSFPTTTPSLSRRPASSLSPNSLPPTTTLPHRRTGSVPVTASSSTPTSTPTRLRMLANLLSSVGTASTSAPSASESAPSSDVVIDSTQLRKVRSVSSFETIPFSLVHAPTGEDLVDDISTCRIPTLTSRRFLSRLFGGLATGGAGNGGPSIRGKVKTIVGDGYPLDGEEGELIDDEACFVDGRDIAGIDLLSMLPFELSLEVFTHLDLNSILACSAVSRNWRTVALDFQVWRELFHRQPGWKVNADLAAAKQLQARSQAPVSSTSSAISRRLSLSFVLPSRRQSAAVSSTPVALPSPSQTPIENTVIPVSLDWPGLFRERRELERHWTDAKYKPVSTQLAGHSDSVYCLEFDSKYNVLVTGSRDRTIKFWNLTTGELRHTLQDHHSGSVLCLKFNAAEGFMVSGSSDKTIIVWDLTGLAGNGPITGTAREVLNGHAGGVLDLRIDSDWIVSCSKDAVVRVWSRHDLKAHCKLAGHDGPVNAVGLQNDHVVSASGDGKIILWDLKTRSRVRTFEGHDRGLACVEFKGDYIISGSNDRKIKIWSVATGECLQTLSGHDGLVRALAFDAAQGRLVSASYDKTVKVWDLSFSPDKSAVTAKYVREFKEQHSSHIFDVKFDAGRIVTSSHDERVVILDFGPDLDTSLFV